VGQRPGALWRRWASTVLVSVTLVVMAAAVVTTPAGAAQSPRGPLSPPTVTASNWQLYYQGSTTSFTGTPGTVSCVTSVFCMASGIINDQTLMQQWNGTTWTTMPSPNVSGADFTAMNSVDCISTSFCAAVGDTDTSPANYTPAAMTWNGSTWTLEQPPLQPGESGDMVLNAVSCLSATWCLAVGYHGDGNTRHPWAQMWNGTGWSIVSVGDPGSGELNGVSCTSQTFCAAVGTTDISPYPLLMETFNGSQWTVSPGTGAAAPAQPSSTLDGVSCIGTSFCQAVGYQAANIFNLTTYATLTEMWNGSGWTYLPSPNGTSNAPNILHSVSCFAVTGCAAVGSAGFPGGTSNDYSGMAQHWDGVSWHLDAVPYFAFTPPEEHQGAVSCVSDWACLTVGSAANATNSFAFDIMAPIARSGYRFVASDGGVFAYGPGAPFLGSLGGTHLNAPIVGIGVMPAGDGYYLVAADGGVFAYGSAQFYGSMGGKPLNKPVVGMAVTPDGGGYWLVASDGGVFAFGDAIFFGSAGGVPLNKPVVGIASTPNGFGYWIVGSDGGIFNYGPAAAYLGSTGGTPLNAPIVGIGATTSGQYYLVGSDGGVFAFPGGAAGPPNYGSAAGTKLAKPIVGMSVLQGGYYLAGSDGGIFAYPTGPGGLPFYGSAGGMTLNAPIVGVGS